MVETWSLVQRNTVKGEWKDRHWAGAKSELGTYVNPDLSTLHRR